MTSGYLRAEESQAAEQAGVTTVLAKPQFVVPLARALYRLFHPEAP